MEDYEIEPIWEKEKPKKIKTGQKGKRVERELCKILNKRFAKLISKNSSWGQFSRSVGSGNRWGQVSNLPKHAKDTFSGDITCPENFKFTIESKGGYNDIDLNSAFDKGHKELDSFLQQALDDAERSGRYPMLIWKKDRKPRLAFISKSTIESELTPEQILTYDYVLIYRDWVAFNLDELLGFEDEFFFNL